jgi:hypothetical protein
MVDQWLSLAMQLVIAEEKARLEAKKTDTRGEKPEGKIYYYKVNVSTSEEHISLAKPCFSLTLSNDGDSPVLLLVNTDKNHTWVEIEPGETEKIDLGKPGIRDFKLKCEAGSTSVRAWCLA